MGKSLRIKCLIIALVFLLIAVGGVVGAFYGGKALALSAISQGSGTADDPYRIYSSNQLTNLQELASSGRCESYTKGKYFKLCNDVRLTNSRNDGDSLYGFYGVFDGDGHTISSGANCLFDRLLGQGEVKNVNFKIGGTVKFPLKREVYFATVTTGAAKGTLIENCHIYGDLRLDFSKYVDKYGLFLVYVGGVCCASYGNVVNCSFNGNILSDTQGLARSLSLSGIAGGNCVVSGCEFNGNIDVTPNAFILYWAGITYYGTAENCTFNGNINQKNYGRNNKHYKFAGQSNRLYGIGRKVQNCTFNGNITNEHYYKFSTCLIAGENSTYTHNGTLPE